MLLLRTSVFERTCTRQNLYLLFESSGTASYAFYLAYHNCILHFPHVLVEYSVDCLHGLGFFHCEIEYTLRWMTEGGLQRLAQESLLDKLGHHR